MTEARAGDDSMAGAFILMTSLRTGRVSEDRPKRRLGGLQRACVRRARDLILIYDICSYRIYNMIYSGQEEEEVNREGRPVLTLHIL
jgi:hypothetical protein